MKKITSIVLWQMALSTGNAQNLGSITSREINPKAGDVNHYVYKPAKNLSIPDKIQAAVAYQNRQQFFCKTIRIDKTGNNYQFSFKAPDSTSVLMFSIIVPGKTMPEKSSLVVEKKIIFDNNNQNGFVGYLHDKTG
jgi:hypothetical protein